MGRKKDKREKKKIAMHIKGKYSWLKHLDFMVLDILSLVVAFVNDGGMNVTQTRGFFGPRK